MYRGFLLITVLLPGWWCFSQNTSTITGILINGQTNKPISRASVYLDKAMEEASLDSSGTFSLITDQTGEFVLVIEVPDLISKRFVLQLEGSPINLGTIVLEPDITLEQVDNLITLTENDLSDDEGTLSASNGLLQATRDIFLTRAAFDFGQAFFRVRGYDSKEGQVLINGMVMNKFFDGRPQWNNWGGLNDVVRNQEFTNGLEASALTFGGILGNTNINTRPSGLRPGTRLSTSYSNRTYSGRVMATFNSGSNPNGLGYAFSGSRRWAKEGHIDGTLYDAYSFFGAMEYQCNPKHTFVLTTILAKNRRGRSSAITEEVFELAGNRYNPYWGIQNGKIRNSRERDIFEPLAMINHFYESKKLSITTGIAYQTGTHTRSRLGYFNAPNPNPTYYRYLPSFYVNNPIGSDFTNAAMAREGFLKNPQINWPQLYTANTYPGRLGKAAYVLYNDTVADSKLLFTTIGNLDINDNFSVDFGASYRDLDSENYAEISDLLGAEFHEDKDSFSDTLNDIHGDVNKQEGAIFSYNYALEVNEWSGFAQLNFSKDQWSGFASGMLSKTEYQRNGLFQNQRHLENSFGKSEPVKFSNYGVKSGISHQLTGRHWLQAHLGLCKRPPTIQNTFINPRENNEVVLDIQSETVSTVDINYLLRLPDLTGRLTCFYTHFQHATDINFFFVDAGVGSDFVQEVITDLDKLHKGVELGLEYQASPQVKLSLAANLGEYTFASNPNVTINFDTAGAEEDVIDPGGSTNLGRADIKGLKLAQGPQTAVALGVEYRDPDYWWIGATTNYLANNYANISTIIRTPSFVLNPETGMPFPEATPENIAPLLEQKPLDNFYLLNLVGGKSWLVDGKYISFFVSVNNAFDELFRTGGFEQSRNGNFGQLQQDNLRNDPSFAPRYWYGFGRTYFVNLALGF
ncbi:carboxypeptidase-like regulatory domain-containing protein [Flavobacteriaceae bacterium GF1]